MPLYTFIHSLLNVLVQIANKMGLQKKIKLCLLHFAALLRSYMLQLTSSETTTHVGTTAMPPVQLLEPNHIRKKAAKLNTVQHGMERVECRTSPREEERFVTERFCKHAIHRI
jgi:hypothetical protein